MGRTDHVLKEEIESTTVTDGESQLEIASERRNIGRSQGSQCFHLSSHEIKIKTKERHGEGKIVSFGGALFENFTKIKKNILHFARHTVATMAVSLGIDIMVISKLLGHRELGTTRIYAKLQDKRKIEEMKKCDIP